MNKIFSIIGIIIMIVSCMTPILNVNAADVYYGKFTNSQLVEKEGYIRVWKVWNQTILFDDNGTSYFTLQKNRIGIFDFAASDDADYKVHGINSYYINRRSGGYLDCDFIKDYYPINLNYYKYLDFYVMPDGTSNQYEFKLIEFSGSHVLYYNLNMNEAAYSWVHHTIILTTMSGDYFTNFRRLYIGNMTSSNVRFDYIRLLSDSYYQVWDGSTLKYTGLNQPDMSDFTSQNTYNYDLVYQSMFIIIWIIVIIAGLVLMYSMKNKDNKIGNVIAGFGSIYGILIALIYFYGYNDLLGVLVILINVCILIYALVDVI